jgi:MoaA/NifB/PqqE/SkfB family radical SAM enzyme
MYNFGYKGNRAVSRFQKRIKKGIYFPAFLFISVTNKCNLRCQGCWVTPTKPAAELSLPTLNNLVASCKEHGISFYGILGGEPLMHSGLFDLFAAHPDCYFVVFTNGTTLTQEAAEKMRQLGNVSPLISIEGLEEVSDERRGGRDVYARAMQGLEYCRKNRLITGVATSICKSNIKDLVSEDFVNSVIKHGVHYLWYYIYRPVGPDPTPELALSPEDITDVRRFIVDIRTKAPIMIVDAYWDHEGKAVCPATLGIGYHISPQGYVEPCPPIQIAKENIGEGKEMYDLLANSKFLEDFRQQVSNTTRGCILLDKPDILTDLMKTHDASDSSGRNTVQAELAAMTPRSSHHQPGCEIPEKSFLYRFAKKKWFFGLGAYG